MNKTGKTLLIGVLIVILLAASYVVYGKLSAKEPSAASGTSVTTADTETVSSGITAGTTETTASAAVAAADFTVYDADGNAVTLSSFQGKPTVVNFWASWCSYCKQELPDFQAAYEQYGDRVNFVMVDLTGGGNDSAADAQSIISKNGYTFPVYFDNDSSAVSAYGIRSIPVTCFIGTDGSLQDSNTGAMSESALTASIESLLG